MEDENSAPSPDSSNEQGSADLASGFLVGGGRFTLLREVARGGMGVVWLAHDERLGAAVALKFLSKSVSTNPAALTDLRQETHKSRMLSHPNIIRIYDLYEAPDEVSFISMEYVDGPNLWTLRMRQPQGCFTWDYLKPVVKQLCEALDYAHSERVIHRDLKPANMLLDDRQRLRLADFGIAARAFESFPKGTEQRSSGTVCYMSPQQLDGIPSKIVDDIYALGATLYELLSGHPPFYENDIVYQVRNVLVTPLFERLADLEIENDVPPGVAAMIMACVSKDPDKRPQSARAVAEWIGQTESGVVAAPNFAPNVIPIRAATVPVAEQPKTVAAPPAPVEESEPPSHREEHSLGRRFGMMAGAIGLGVLTWLAWTHFIPKMPEFPLANPAPSTNAAGTPVVNSNNPAPIPTATPVVPSSGGFVIELGEVNVEKGLKQVELPDGNTTVPANIGGKECRHLIVGSRPRARCFFQLSPGFKHTGPLSARIEVEYYAALTGAMQIQYDSSTGRAPHYANGGRKDFNGDRVWKRAYFQVDDAVFARGERGGADFSLTTSCRELYIHKIAVFPEQ